MASLDGRGEGFVHLNTPASIHYTSGQKVSLTDLRRRSSRVDCVVLPATQSLWRLGAQCYTTTEGYPAFAGDAEDEKAGEGPILPPLATATRKRPRYSRTTGDPTNFFVGRHTVHSPPLTADSTASPAVASTTPAGIAIVSHHKVSGRGEFVYPDYDGVLSSGVVPEVVTTAEERRQEEERRKHYLSPLNMTPDELDAFEALQGLWQARARSRSAQGAKWRAVSESAQGTGSSTASLKAPRRLPATDGDGPHLPASHGTAPAQVDAEDEGSVTDPSEREFADVLRLADELLRFI